jgi:hypothetical protein
VACNLLDSRKNNIPGLGKFFNLGGGHLQRLTVQMTYFKVTLPQH